MSYTVKESSYTFISTVNWPNKGNFCCNHNDSLSVIPILKQHASWCYISQKTQKLCLIPLGSLEAGQSFSFIRRIYKCLCNSTLMDLSDVLLVTAIHGYMILVLNMQCLYEHPS